MSSSFVCRSVTVNNVKRFFEQEFGSVIKHNVYSLYGDVKVTRQQLPLPLSSNCHNVNARTSTQSQDEEE